MTSDQVNDDESSQFDALFRPESVNTIGIKCVCFPIWTFTTSFDGRWDTICESRPSCREDNCVWEWFRGLLLVLVMWSSKWGRFSLHYLAFWSRRGTIFPCLRLGLGSNHNSTSKINAVAAFVNSREWNLCSILFLLESNNVSIRLTLLLNLRFRTLQLLPSCWESKSKSGLNRRVRILSGNSRMTRFMSFFCTHRNLQTVKENLFKFQWSLKKSYQECDHATVLHAG